MRALILPAAPSCSPRSIWALMMFALVEFVGSHFWEIFSHQNPKFDLIWLCFDLDWFVFSLLRRATVLGLIHWDLNKVDIVFVWNCWFLWKGRTRTDYFGETSLRGPENQPSQPMLCSVCNLISTLLHCNAIIKLFLISSCSAICHHF